MKKDDLYVYSGAMMKCTMGTSLARLTVPQKHDNSDTGNPKASINDHKPLVNFGLFGRCRSLGYPATAAATAAAHGRLTPMPCMHNTPFPWTNGMKGEIDNIVNDKSALLKSDTCQCLWGGTISFVSNGQTSEEQIEKNEQLEENGIDSKKCSESKLWYQLTICGSEYEECHIKVENPNKSIRDQIQNIIDLLKLPSIGYGNQPIRYSFALLMEDCEDPLILKTKDENGRELSLLDYEVQPGDHLLLISYPITDTSPAPRSIEKSWRQYAYACPIPEGMKKEWAQYCLQNE